MNSKVPKKEFSNPQDIAEAGQKIYADNYVVEYEKKYSGQFAAIDVTTGKAYVAELPDVALENAKKENSDGIFHLIRVGASGAFRVSYSSNANRDWLFRQSR